MGRRSKFRVAATLLLLAILLSGSATISVIVSGIYLALAFLVILCLLLFLAAIAYFGKKKS